MKNVIFTIIILCIFGCGVDVTDPQAGYFDDHTDKSGTNNFNNTGSGTMNVNINYNNNSASAIVSVNEEMDKKTTDNNTKSYFGKDLQYIGISKDSNGANLVMKNNTRYRMSISVNYTVSCKVNNKLPNTVTKTLTFTMEMYEQKESSSSIDGYWYAGLDTIECSGIITSIIPTSYDKSNFQPWSGSYNFEG